MRSNQIIGLFFFCLLIFGCKKDSENLPPEDHIDTNFVDNNLKQNYLFNVGSKWIYKSAKSDFDTVEIITQEHLFVGPYYLHGNIIQTNCEEYYYTYYKSNTKDSLVDVYNHHSIMRNPTGYSWDGYNSGWIFISWFKPGDSIRETKLLEIIDSLLIQGKIYYNISKIQVHKDQNENNYNTYYYFAPHFGIIRKEIEDSITWNLYESDIK